LVLPDTEDPEGGEVGAVVAGAEVGFIVGAAVAGPAAEVAE
jgi:hypothetical protein